MAYAITQTCCADASCVSVCPVNCIHPTPEEREFGSTEMLHVDPRSCIDCGACADACPVDAIFPVDSLFGPQKAYAEVNAAYFEDRPEPVATDPNFHEWTPPRFERSLPADFGPLRVAVVGTGPAGMYSAEDLLLHTNAEVTLIDRLEEAGGLMRHGVAPDHPATRRISERFERFHDHPRARTHLGVEVGRDVTHEQLAAHHDAVIHAVGAPGSRGLGIPGEELPGSLPATEVVGWYNCHPEVAPDAVRLDSERVVVIGTGNVALDVARILVSDPDELAETSIAPHALSSLRSSRVREVVLLGRRGPDHAAYTDGELFALTQMDGVDLVVDGHDPQIGRVIDTAGRGEKAATLQRVTRERVDWSRPPPTSGPRRIVLRFGSTPTELAGRDRVDAVKTAGSDGAVIPTGLVVRAVGHRGVALPGLPFDDERGVVPNQAGRVEQMPGTYVVGWIKRGPTGGIGANRACAAETVGALLEDAVAGWLPQPTGGRRALRKLLRPG